MDDLYNKIAELCKERHITPYRLCRDLQLSPSVLSDLKTGRKKTLHLDTLQKITQYLGVSYEVLTGRNTNSSEKTAMAMMHGVVIGFGGAQKPIEITKEEYENIRQFLEMLRKSK